MPFVSDFTETNLRTYVIGPDGRDGLWFFTLETDSLPTVLGARSARHPVPVGDDGGRRRSGTELAYGSRRRAVPSTAMHMTRVDEDGSDEARATLAPSG